MKEIDTRLSTFRFIAASAAARIQPVARIVAAAHTAVAVMHTAAAVHTAVVGTAVADTVAAAGTVVVAGIEAVGWYTVAAAARSDRVGEPHSVAAAEAAAARTVAVRVRLAPTGRWYQR